MFIDILSMSALFLGSILLGILGINSPQSNRPIVLVGVISLALLAFSKITDEIWGAEIFAIFILIYVSHISCLLCVEEYRLPEKPAGSSFGWVRGYKMLSNPRWLGTTRQVSNIEVRPTKISHMPRLSFVLNCVYSAALTIATERAFRYFSTDILPRYVYAPDITDFLPAKEVYFRRIGSVTLNETVIRVQLVASFIIYSIYTYKTMHNILAIVFVGSGFDNPEDWPPLFGNIKEATSIRNFWARFWHQLVYRSFTSYGIWITKNVLGLPRSSFIGRLFITLFVFAMSGVVHALAIRQAQYSCGAWEEIQFYILNFFGILLETMTYAAVSKLTKDYKMKDSISNAIGYSWVFLFLFWVLPKSNYPRVFCNP